MKNFKRHVNEKNIGLEIGLVIKSEVVCWSTIFKIKLPRQSHILIIFRSLNGYTPTKARELSNCIDNCRWILCRAACRRAGRFRRLTRSG